MTFVPLKQPTINYRLLYACLFIAMSFGGYAQHSTITVRLSDVKGTFPLDSLASVSEWNNGKRVPVMNKALPTRDKVYSIDFSIFNDYPKDTLYYVRNCDNGTTEIFVRDSAGKIILQQKTGYYVDISKRFGNDEQGFLPVPLKAGQYAEVQLLATSYNGNKPDLSATVYSPEAYYKFYRNQIRTANTQEYITIFFLGAIFMIMVFFLFMYLKSRQALYGRYAFYLSMQFVYGFLRTGPNSLIGYWTLNAPILKASLIAPIILTAVAGYAWFLNELLDLRRQRPSLYRQMRWIAIFLWCYSVAHWSLYYFIPNLPFQALSFLVIRMILVIINLYILLSVAFFVRSNIKSYYIIGNSLFLIFGVVAGFKEINNVFSGTYFARFNNANWFMIGILLEGILFAFALGIRMKELQDEKDDATRRLIAQMQVTEQVMLEANQKLEQKVQERTAKILSQEKQIEQVRLQETKAAYEKQLSESRMQALRSRMNPHFLFNSLNSIKYFILKNENDSAAFYLNRFSKLLRHILEYSNHETITLQQELDTLKLYLEIESLRFDQSFHYDISVSEDILPEKILIPPLILQPFVENAIWHGLANSEKPDKFCNVDVVRQNGHILINIEDNGVGRTAAAVFRDNKFNKLKTESFGLKITEERISIFNTGSNGKLQIAVLDNEDQSQQPSGTTIRITLQN